MARRNALLLHIEYITGSAYSCLGISFFLFLCAHMNARSNQLMGLSLFAERISRRQKSECTVHQFGLPLNPQTRVGVHCKADFDEQSSADRKDPGSVIDSSGLKGGSWLQPLRQQGCNLAINNYILPGVSTVTHTHGAGRDIKTVQVKGGFCSLKYSLLLHLNQFCSSGAVKRQLSEIELGLL